MSTESFTTNKKERMQEGVSLAQGEKKHLAGQQLTPRYEVVQQLKDARKAQDMTQEVLAERVGTKKSNISRFESGKYNPSLDFLIKVAGSLGAASKMIEQIMKKYKKGCSVAETADMLEENPSVIEQIYDILRQNAPDYDVQKIYQSLLKKNTQDSLT